MTMRGEKKVHIEEQMNFFIEMPAPKGGKRYSLKDERHRDKKRVLQVKAKVMHWILREGSEVRYEEKNIKDEERSVGDVN